ncbi:EamA/RhaT family transporter [Pigmentiphaga aceris]|nr:EamA/RhaT family transporter [Pigmentiphaga aceris]
MTYLILSMLCSVGVSVLLKLAAQFGVDTRQAIAVNYGVAATMTALLLKPQLASLAQPRGGAAFSSWALILALGVLLPSVFLAMAAAVRHAGIVRSDAAQRLSLFIPVIAAFTVFGESVETGKLMGLALALAAMTCLVGRYRPGMKGDTSDAGSEGAWRWLLVIWLGYGSIDIMFKQVAKAGTAFAPALLASFVLAGIVMLIWLTWHRVRWDRRNVAGGVLLGLLNFANILFYIRAHQHFANNPTLVFATMNIGVVALGTVVGALAFRERLSARHGLGIALTLLAIVVMLPK